MIRTSIAFLALLASSSINAQNLSPLPVTQRAFQERIGKHIQPGRSLPKAIKWLKASRFHCSKVEDAALTLCKRSVIKKHNRKTEYRVLLGYKKSKVTSVAVILKRPK